LITMSLRTASVIAFLFASCLLQARAARPLQTDDAGVLAKGDCEFEGATQRLSAPGQTATETGLQVGCGVAWDSQLAVAAAVAREDGVRTTSLAVGGKTGLWKSAGGDVASSLALSWQLLGSQQAGRAWRHAGTAASLLWSMPLVSHFTLHANLGHNRKELDHYHATTWGVAIEQAGLGANKRWMLMAELFGDDHERPWWNLGLRVAVVPNKLLVALSYGRQFSPERPALLTLSLKAAL
jgi:hypothetical protein